MTTCNLIVPDPTTSLTPCHHVHTWLCLTCLASFVGLHFPFHRACVNRVDYLFLRRVLILEEPSTVMKVVSSFLERPAKLAVLRSAQGSRSRHVCEGKKHRTKCNPSTFTTAMPSARLQKKIPLADTNRPSDSKSTQKECVTYWLA